MVLANSAIIDDPIRDDVMNSVVDTTARFGMRPRSRSFSSVRELLQSAQLEAAAATASHTSHEPDQDENLEQIHDLDQHGIESTRKDSDESDSDHEYGATVPGTNEDDD